MKFQYKPGFQVFASVRDTIVCADSVASYFITVVKCTLLGSKTLNCCSSNADLIQWHFSALGCIAAVGWLGTIGLLDNLVKRVLLKIQ